MQNNPSEQPFFSGAAPVKKLATAGLIVLKGNKLLLAFSKNKKAWYLPGGKLDDKETPVQSLIRETEEELGVRLPGESLKYLFHISAAAFGESAGIIMEQDCFLGPSDQPYQATSEIGAIRYFSFAEYAAQTPIVPGVMTAFEKLAATGLL